MLGLATQEVMKLPGVDLQFITELLLIFLVSTLRIGAFLLSSPIFGARWLPLQVRIVMAFAFGTAIAGQTPPFDVVTLTSAAGVMMMLVEIAIGLTAGLTLTIWFSGFLK
jgi:flagellar biosynthetic protein FliR